jgi:hypothetical protein
MIARRLNAVSLAVLGFTLALAPAVAKTSSLFSSERREAIGQPVGEYLLKNPEALQEAFTELERRTQELQRAARFSALRPNGPSFPIRRTIMSSAIRGAA